MVHKCSVPFCKGNYDSKEKVHVFRFPRDENLKQKWIAAIGRENFTPTKYSRVCHKHFTTEEVLWIASCFDVRNNKLVTAPLHVPRLKEDAVPSIFWQCPENNNRKYRKKSVLLAVDETESNFTEKLEACIKQERQNVDDSNSVEEPRKIITPERLDIRETNSNAREESVPYLIKQERHDNVGEVSCDSSSSAEQERQDFSKPSSLIKQEVDGDVDSSQACEEQTTGTYNMDFCDLPDIQQDLADVQQKNDEEPTTLPTISHYGSIVVTLKPTDCKSVVVNLEPSSPDILASLEVKPNTSILKSLLIENRVEMGSPELKTKGKANILDESFLGPVHPKSVSLFNKYKSILSGEAVFKCYQCKQTFDSPLHYRRHKYEHADERKYQCLVCNKRFYSVPHLKRHESIHSCQKKFQCHLCQKRFAKKCHLETHTLAHTGEKPFKCPLCHKCYTSSVALSNHLLTHTGQQLFECRHCNKRFSGPSQCRSHEARHSAEGQYKCQLCPQSFHTKHHLKVHEYVHTGHKQFRCSLCPKEFHIKKYLKYHEEAHATLSYHCPLCPKGFQLKKSLNQHLRGSHVCKTPTGSQWFVQYKDKMSALKYVYLDQNNNKTLKLK